MANTINLAKTYSTVLDEVYKNASLTSILDGAPELMREGFNAEEIVIPMIDMQGLADYSRNSGYVNGDVTVTWQTKKCNFNRGRMFKVDRLDDIETGGIAFGRLAGEFVRTKVVPELDAFRFATYASTPGVSAATPGTIADGKAAVKAIREALAKMDEDEVPTEGRLLFITSPLLGAINDLDTTASRAVLAECAGVIKVPQTRFYTKIKQLNGQGEDSAGGFEKDVAGKDINFMLIHPSATIQFNKLVAPKIVAPDNNQETDDWKYGYRQVSLAELYNNKLAGIYVHNKA